MLTNKEYLMSFNDRAKALQARLAYCIDDVRDITKHTVTRGWYHNNVDMDVNTRLNDTIDIVQVSYSDEMGAYPFYCTIEHFMTTPLAELADEVAI